MIVLPRVFLLLLPPFPLLPSCLPKVHRIRKFPQTYSDPCPYRARGVTKRMPEVIIHDDESFERALKRFKKSVKGRYPV